MESLPGSNPGSPSSASDPLRQYSQEDRLALCWKYVHKLEVPQQNIRGALCTHICTICVKESKPWKTCLIAVYKGKSSNATGHLRKHREYEEAVLREQQRAGVAKLKGENVTPSNKRKRITALKENMFTCEGTLSPLKEEFNHSMADFVLRCGLPSSTLTHRSLGKLLNVATKLPTMSSFHDLATTDFSKLVENQMIASFCKFITLVETRVRESRDSCNRGIQAARSHPGFLSLMVNKWVGVYHGVSIAWIDLDTWKLHNVTIALARPIHDKLSRAMIVKMVQRYGMHMNDIHHEFEYELEPMGLQDFAGLKTEYRLQRTCAVVTRALLQSRSQKVLKLVKKCVACVEYLNGRWDTYLVAAQDGGLQPPQINDTLAGALSEDAMDTYQLLKLLVQSFHCISYFVNNALSDTKATVLSQNEWDIVAELEALIRPFCSTPAKSFGIGKEQGRVKPRSPSISMKWLLGEMRKFQCSRESYEVVNLHCDSKWDANTEFEEIPKVKMGIHAVNPNGEVQLSPQSLHLRERLLEELKHVFPAPTKHELIAMICDPIIITSSKDALKAMNLWDEAWSHFQEIFWVEAQRRKQNRKGEAKSPRSNESETSAFLQHFRQKVADDVVEEIVSPEQELENWKSLRISWIAEFRLQRPDLNDWTLDQGELRDAFFLHENLDLLGWFQRNHGNFEIISNIAARYLATPTPDTHQHVDVSGLLSECKGSDTFEMRALLALNGDWIYNNDSYPESPSSHQGNLCDEKGLLKRFFSNAPLTAEAAAKSESVENALPRGQPAGQPSIAKISLNTASPRMTRSSKRQR
uniref:Uncharacterized protein n=1 Tax=Mucochytrium quahogii TaxID=96639 RepID=A0A7S2RXG3_9STRA|mmetsp:Transcript_18205/g.29592  ORF Transcript_18205/g.29592 Transcript_18205/m.29592 type:complete len:810 (+) Transcript_18205:392-2821(+)|eukprot:CAMPEP_0203784224 /NCGR_PEP_ID=MMETSP0100_2-20121128/347_1 /ASSEMBLY_ACC=CAM_ASM_000210 /TAXON_ID=96639 /ORGANISM=" , Strain NY0313808BC1" /LENGTH=809 /DNA_ID=CAMNT_0050686181 /DNA_START=324 /DNA_END=2753 /DNA_ORIENTATION=-